MRRGEPLQKERKGKKKKRPSCEGTKGNKGPVHNRLTQKEKILLAGQENPRSALEKKSQKTLGQTSPETHLGQKCPRRPIRKKKNAEKKRTLCPIIGQTVDTPRRQGDRPTEKKETEGKKKLTTYCGRKKKVRKTKEKARLTTGRKKRTVRFEGRKLWGKNAAMLQE